LVYISKGFVPMKLVASWLEGSKKRKGSKGKVQKEREGL
jgi:hypothetical protein